MPLVKRRSFTSWSWERLWLQSPPLVSFSISVLLPSSSGDGFGTALRVVPRVSTVLIATCWCTSEGSFHFIYATLVHRFRMAVIWSCSLKCWCCLPVLLPRCYGKLFWSSRSPLVLKQLCGSGGLLRERWRHVAGALFIFRLHLKSLHTPSLNLAWPFGVTIEWPKVLWHFSVLVKPWSVYCRCLLRICPELLNRSAVSSAECSLVCWRQASHKSICHSVSLIIWNPSRTLWLPLANIPYNEPLLLALQFFTMSLD